MLHHIVLPADWEKQKLSPDYEAESLTTEGFIHLSTPEQLEETLQRFFKAYQRVVILHIDTSLLEATLVYEEVPQHGRFPHLFGRLNKNAIVEVEDRLLSLS
jgi:uncharacterized protein (DUF952 family)